MKTIQSHEKLTEEIRPVVSASVPKQQVFMFKSIVIITRRIIGGIIIEPQTLRKEEVRVDE